MLTTIRRLVSALIAAAVLFRTAGHLAGTLAPYHIMATRREVRAVRAGRYLPLEEAPMPTRTGYADARDESRGLAVVNGTGYAWRYLAGYVPGYLAELLTRASRRRRILETTACAVLLAVTAVGVSLSVVSEYGTPDTGAELAPAAASSPVPARRVALRWLTRHPRFLDLPSCTYEDASSGPVPCSWNVHNGDGNGYGDAYFVTGSNARPVFHDIAGGAR